MPYRTSGFGNNISPQDLFDLRSKNFNELERAISLSDSRVGTPPLRRSPIEWTPEKGHILSEKFSQINYPYRNHLSNLLIEGFGRELQLFAISLDAYIESGFEIPVSKIIYLASLGPKGSSLLKKARKELFKRKINSVDFVDPPYNSDLEDLISGLSLSDIDNVFNYRHMPMWIEEVKDLEDYSYIEVKNDPQVVKEFRETLSELLKGLKPPEEDNRIEILLSSSRSKSLASGQKIFHFEKPQRSLNIDQSNFSNSIGECLRSIIPVQPQSFRDAVIVDWKAKNTIQFIERRVRHFLHHLPYHNYTDDNVRFYNSIRRFYTYGDVFVCRDIKKEGLTKPRYLLKIMLEELSKIDPLLKDYIDFYEDFNIRDHKKPLRGHGQGMANALTTLMQITIIQMINNLLAASGFTETITSLCYNDDCVTKVSEEMLDEFWDLEGYIMKGLGILRSDEKSFHSKLGFIYCEMYISPLFPNASIKQMVSRRNVLYSFLYDFPYEVKNYLSSIANNSYLREYLEEIILTFGYEFFPEEIQYPLSIGGWIPDKVFGLSDAVIELEKLDYDIRVYCCYRASKIKEVKYPLPKRVLRSNLKKSFLERIFPGYSKDLKKYLPLGRFKDLYYKYQLYREDQKLDFLVRKRISEVRKKKYLERVSSYPTLEDFQKELISEGKYLLPRNYCSFKDPTFFVEDIERDPYKQDTPVENYLSKLGILVEARSPYREEYSISTSQYSFHLRKDERYFITPEEEQEELLGIPFEEESFYSVDRITDNTAVFLLAHYKFYGQLPVVHGIPEHPYKKEVYNSYLTMEEYIDLSNLKYNRWSFLTDRKIFDLIQKTEIEPDLLDDLIDESREIDVDDQKETSSDSDESITEEEAIRLRSSIISKKKPLTTESLQAILLAKEDPDGYEYSEILSSLVAPTLFFYNHHDSVSGINRFEKIRRYFEEKFLKSTYLTSLLVSSCEEGYLRDLGEALGVYTPSDSEEDFGISLLG